MLIAQNYSTYFSSVERINDRKYANWLLFTEGTYIDRAGNTIISTGGTLLECAKYVHDYMAENKYYYCTLGGESAKTKSAHVSAGLSCGLSSSFEASKVPGNNGYRLTCCATYVSWVLEEAGYLQTHVNGCSTLVNQLSGLGWIKITSYNELLPGDIVFMDTDSTTASKIDHVQLYLGNNSWYNAGNIEDIQRFEPKTNSNCSGVFTYAYRAPN